MQQTVVVTGGGTGIGRAVAEHFLLLGAQVTITGRRAAALEQAASSLSGTVNTATFDASDPTEVREFAEHIGPIDVLVNNAGGNTDFDGLPAATLDEIATAWQANFRANVLTAVLMTYSLLPVMRSPGAIISIGSIAADKGSGSYGAAKAAIASWNIGVANEVGPRGITANVVSPGYIAGTEFFRKELTDERRSELIDAAMTQRAGSVDDIAHTVAFLASANARQITGQTISVNGGERTTR